MHPALLPLLPLMRTPRLPVVDRTDAPADLNGLVRFAERRNLVSARVPSHFKRTLPNEQTGEVGEPSKKQRYFGRNRRELNGKIFSLQASEG